MVIVKSFLKKPLAVYYNFIGENLPRVLVLPKKETEMRVVEHMKSVQVVFLGTSLLAGENHPLYLHGYSIYGVNYEGF